MTQKQKWTQYLEEWKASGLSQSGFCRNRNLKLSTFQYYRKILKHSPIEQPFVKISIPENISMPEQVSISFGRYIVSLGKAFDKDFLRDIVSVLKEL
jgi:hypothetical protein